MALHVDANRGTLLLAAMPYDDTVVDGIRALPERRYRHGSQDWSVPATRERLRDVSKLIGELDERGVDVQISPAAGARLARIDVGRATLRDGAIEIAGPYSDRRLPALRDLPERRFDAEHRIWTVPLTRAGALALLALADETDELVLTRRARDALTRSAAANSAWRDLSDSDAAPGPARRSPIAHWRHYTSGPVFDNPARGRVHVPGIGICVRVRVNPEPRYNDQGGGHEGPSLPP